jgi:hypothetical protein
VFPDWACYRRRCVALSGLNVPLCNAEEAGRGAIATVSLVSVAVWAVKVIKGVFVGATAFAANHKVLVASAVVHGVAQMEAAYTLR